MTIRFDRVLRYRLPMMQGEDVRLVQLALFRLGLGTEQDIDSLYGPNTRKRVEVFQARVGLTADGVVDDKTLLALGVTESGGQPVANGGADGPAAPAPGPAQAAKGRLIPAGWMPEAKMKRIILHWTGGAYTPSAHDKACYHILIDGDARLHRGLHGIDDNVPPLRDYAAHTWHANSYSIGLSLCCMLNGHESNLGNFPIRKRQWTAMARAAAELCLRYGIEVRRETVLGHGEVQDILGITQKQKWDPMVIPWARSLTFREVGDQMRQMVRDGLDDLRGTGTQAETEPLPRRTVQIDGVPLAGVEFDARTWLPLDQLVRQFGWSVPAIADGVAHVAMPALSLAVAAPDDDIGEVYVEVPVLADTLGLALSTDSLGAYRMTTPDRPDTAGAPPETVVVLAGDTLSGIARRWLGDASRWVELTESDGRRFDDSSARSLRIGQVVRLPDGTAAAPVVVSPGNPLPDDEVERIAQAIAAGEPRLGGAANRQTARAAVAAILKACVANGVNDHAHQAYILATAFHETDLGINIVEKWVPTADQARYGSRTDLGNTSESDGKLFRGRGFVQITGRGNYKRYGKIFGQDFVSQPELVAQPDIAAAIIVRGMSELGFRGPRRVLSAYGVHGSFDFISARQIVNADSTRPGKPRYTTATRAEGIAATAMSYLELIDHP